MPLMELNEENMKKVIVFSCICSLLASLITYSVIKYMEPKVAILYIATGRYIFFWEKFYSSMEKNFLPEYKKHYFVFTNHKYMDFPDNVTVIYRPKKGFPGDSIERFDMFLSIKDQLKKYDYTYFLNANAYVVRPVRNEILPSPEQKITVAWHPGYYRERLRETYPYDQNPLSTAYIPEDKGKYYVQGGFNGGITKDYLEMAEVLSNDIKENKKRGIMARWHDESHLNHYIIDKNPLVMPPTYVWATFDYTLLDILQDDIRIEMRYKDDYGGTDWLRGHTDEKMIVK